MTAYEAQVADVREVGVSTVAMELSIDGDFDGLPGQFVLLQGDIGGEEEKGYYTISSPSVGELFEVTIGVDPESTFSAWLANRAVGDTVAVEGPFGNIAYDDAGDVVTVAGGPGIGAALAIAERAHQQGHDSTVFYEADEPAHLDRLDALESAGQSITVLDAEDSDALIEALNGDNIGDEMVYVFGYSDFCSRVRDTIDTLAVEPAALHVESFG